MSIKIYNLQSHNNVHVAPSGDLYVSEGYFREPSVTMRSLGNGHQMNGAMTCLNFDGFKCVEDIDNPSELRDVIVKLTELIMSRDAKYADLIDKYSALQEDHGELLIKAHKWQDAARGNGYIL